MGTITKGHAWDKHRFMNLQGPFDVSQFQMSSHQHNTNPQSFQHQDHDKASFTLNYSQQVTPRMGTASELLSKLTEEKQITCSERHKRKTPKQHNTENPPNCPVATGREILPLVFI